VHDSNTVRWNIKSMENGYFGGKSGLSEYLRFGGRKALPDMTGHVVR